MTSKLLLITGLPGTGKTTLGHYLQSRHGFYHFDREVFDQWPRWQRRLWNKHLPLFVWLMQWWCGKVVVTWGFSPHHDLSIIRKLSKLGFYLAWFDGDRKLAYQNYLRRGGGNRAAFFVQLFQIDRLNATELPIHHFNPFTRDGEFKDKEKQVKEIIGEI